MSDLLHRHSRIPGKVDSTLVMGISPTNIANLSLWVAADHYSYNDMDSITTLIDLSGLGHNLTGTAYYYKNIINSLPVIGFQSYHSNKMYTTYNQGNPFTLFACYKMVEGSAARVISSQSANWLFGNWSGTHDNYFAGSGFVLQTQTAEDYIPHVWTCTQTGSLSTIWRHRTQLASNNNGVTAIGQLSLGGYSSGEYSDCDICEVFTYDRVLGSDEITSMQNYLISKWGVVS